ncbi:hypothetical protein [Romboutsia sp. 1001713B170131_170501_G6]|uniref:hypothetical protein n=1 Tax=Romboutsia sp. 1001713B170131_170501_G6 TaxID=2787108 RepID=UPI0018A9A95B|nr:hypothetical protein [Romboutsia sp. 1001713B170131_170501_G6]
MTDKLTYKIQNLLLTNEYTDIKVSNKVNGEEMNIKEANIKFRYEPKEDKGYLSFGECKNTTVCEVEDSAIDEVVVYDDSLRIETKEKTYYCYKDSDKMYF